MTYEGLRLKILALKRIKLANIRKKKINKEKFTIISNNCWGGEVYESYNLIKQSPTIGLFFMASDYIKFIKNIHYYLDQPLKFIDPQTSTNIDYFENDKFYGNYPVAKLGDIEIFFMHYKSEKEVIQNWNRRVKRINWDHILYKFNDQNGCTLKEIKEFSELPVKHKICFTVRKDFEKYSNVVRVKSPKSHSFVYASYEPFGNNKDVNVNELINSL